VLEPSVERFEALCRAAPSAPSHDGGDTGLLNSLFPDWWTGPPATRLAFRYNAQRTMYWMTHAKRPGYWAAVEPIKVLHFSSSPKPWDASNHKKGDLEMLWWERYVRMQLMTTTSSTSSPTSMVHRHMGTLPCTRGSRHKGTRDLTDDAGETARVLPSAAAAASGASASAPRVDGTVLTGGPTAVPAASSAAAATGT